MCLFLDLLPTDLQICIVLTWIAADCCDDAGILSVLSALDIACCSHGSRPAYLELAAGFPFAVHTQSKLFAGMACYLAWLQSRQVQVRSLHLSQENVLRLNQTALPSVEHVIVHQLDASALTTQLVEMCPNMTSLDLIVASSSLRSPPAQPPRLRVITFDDDDDDDDDPLLALLARNGAHLESLSISSEWAPTSSVEEFCVSLAQHCPVLSDLRIKHLSSDCVSSIISVLSAKHLKELGIGGRAAMSDAGIATILTAAGSKQQLKSISFRRNYLLHTFTFCLGQMDILGLDFVQVGRHSFCRRTSHLVLNCVGGLGPPSDDDVDNLLAVVPTVRKLSLMCGRFSVAMLNKIGEKCGSAVDEMYILNVSLENFARTTLLQHCAVTKLTFRLLIPPEPSQHGLCNVQLHYLQHLNAEYKLNGQWGNGYLTLMGMLGLFRKCTALKTLKCALHIDALVFATLQAIVDNRLPLQSFTYSASPGCEFVEGDLEKFRQLAKEVKLLPVTSIVHVLTL